MAEDPQYSVGFCMDWDGEASRERRQQRLMSRKRASTDVLNFALLIPTNAINARCRLLNRALPEVEHRSMPDKPLDRNRKASAPSSSQIYIVLVFGVVEC